MSINSSTRELDFGSTGGSSSVIGRQRPRPRTANKRTTDPKRWTRRTDENSTAPSATTGKSLSGSRVKSFNPLTKETSFTAPAPQIESQRSDTSAVERTILQKDRYAFDYAGLDLRIPDYKLSPVTVAYAGLNRTGYAEGFSELGKHSSITSPSPQETPSQSDSSQSLQEDRDASSTVQEGPDSQSDAYSSGPRTTTSPPFEDSGRDVNGNTGSASSSRMTVSTERIWIKITDTAFRFERDYQSLRRIRHEKNERSKTTISVKELRTVVVNHASLSLLIFRHPGPNGLAEYLPSWFLPPYQAPKLATIAPALIDMATFVDLAIQIAQIVETIHQSGEVHGEICTQTFHWNASSNLVSLQETGAGVFTLEGKGGLSAVILRIARLPPEEASSAVLALSFLAPEQITAAQGAPDHRIDLYAIGMYYWTLIMGQKPYDGDAQNILTQVQRSKPEPVTRERADVPPVIGAIIDKLLSKRAGDRYFSALGLLEDLQICQRQLTLADASNELIPAFPLAQKDLPNMFILPEIIFGREQELALITTALVNLATTHRSAQTISSLADDGAQDDFSIAASNLEPSFSQMARSNVPSSTADCILHSRRSSTADALSATPPPSTPLDTSSIRPEDVIDERLQQSNVTHAISARSFESTGTGGSVEGGSVSRTAMTKIIAISGPGGVGKSSLAQQVEGLARELGFWAHTRFDAKKTTPYSAILSALSILFRQLLVRSPKAVQLYRTKLQTQLGPQVTNLGLLLEKVPEMQEIFGYELEQKMTDLEIVTSAENKARFHSLILDVLRSLTVFQFCCLQIDDLHKADDASLDLISALTSSKLRLLLIFTYRVDDRMKGRLDKLFGTGAHVARLHLQPLGHDSVARLVGMTLHREEKELMPLVESIIRYTRGNAFWVRNSLISLRRQNIIWFDVASKNWTFEAEAVDTFLARSSGSKGLLDVNLLTTQIQNLGPRVSRFLLWASMFGSTFDFRDIEALMRDESQNGERAFEADVMSAEEREGDSAHMARQFSIDQIEDGSDEQENGSNENYLLSSLAAALHDGIIHSYDLHVYRFTHDRYHQAAQMATKDTSQVARMHLKIAQLLMSRSGWNNDFAIADHLMQCQNYVIALLDKTPYIKAIKSAGDYAAARGSHDLALKFYDFCRQLMGPRAWQDPSYHDTYSLTLSAADLYWYKANIAASDQLIIEILRNARSTVHRTEALRIRHKNLFYQRRYKESIDVLVDCLNDLGLQLSLDYSSEATDQLYYYLAEYFDKKTDADVMGTILANNEKVDTIASILTEASTAAYWSGIELAPILSLSGVQVAMTYGLTPSSCASFVLMGELAQTRFSNSQLSARLGNIGTTMANQLGNSLDKGRTNLLHVNHTYLLNDQPLAASIPILETAMKHSLMAGDRMYCAFNLVTQAVIRFLLGFHLSDTSSFIDEAIAEVENWSAEADGVVFLKSLGACCRILQSDGSNVEAFDQFETGTEKNQENLQTSAMTISDSSRAWCLSLQVHALFMSGQWQRAYTQGIMLWDVWERHPNVRLVRWSLTLSAIAGLRSLGADDDGKRNPSSEAQAARHAQRALGCLEAWHSSSPIAFGTMHDLLRAELEVQKGDHERAMSLYDSALKYARNGNWLADEGIVLVLFGSFLGERNLGTMAHDLLTQSIKIFRHYGNHIVVRFISQKFDQSMSALVQYKSSKLMVDSTIQTDIYSAENDSSDLGNTNSAKAEVAILRNARGDALSKLDLVSLTSIIQHSHRISFEAGVNSSLARLTEIVMEEVEANFCFTAIKQDDGEFMMATMMHRNEEVEVFEPARTIADNLENFSMELLKTVILNKDVVFCADVYKDPRFAEYWAERGWPSVGVICMPLLQKSSMVGLLYLAGHHYNIDQRTLTLLWLLADQTAISIANPMLFQRLQRTTRANIRMIESQKKALDEAKRSREEALTAMKVKSNFLASMSHELRTPFSSTHGLLGLLSETVLDAEQRDLVRISQESCSLLLEIIDSLLDYTKLEANAVKLDIRPFEIEDLLAGCVQLLQSSAMQKDLHLGFLVNTNVPLILMGDVSRIRQIIVNLMGNGIKFTSVGCVTIRCSLEQDTSSDRPRQRLRIDVCDTGMGMAKKDISLLFMPFQQISTGATRAHGGTGLGLSICKQLVQLMGGEIHATSEPGQGSVFSFCIDASLAPEETQELEQQLEPLRQAVAAKTKKFLLLSMIEESANFVRTSMRTLTFESIIGLDNALGALRRTDDGIDTDQAYDFIFIDFQEVDKVKQIMDECMKHKRFEKTKAIHLTVPSLDTIRKGTKGGDPTEDVSQAATPGLTTYSKPVREQSMLQVLLTMMDTGGKTPGTKDGPRASSQGLRSFFTSADLDRLADCRILIADDNPIARSLLHKQLQKLGVSVVPTENGELAVEAWNEHEEGYFSLAIFDHHMPVKDGMAATRDIRALERKKKCKVKLPIAALTADCQSSSIRSAFDAGFNAFLQKPLRMEKLKKVMIEHILERREERVEG